MEHPDVQRPDDLLGWAGLPDAPPTRGHEDLNAIFLLLKKEQAPVRGKWAEQRVRDERWDLRSAGECERVARGRPAPPPRPPGTTEEDWRSASSRPRPGTETEIRCVSHPEL